VIWPFMITHCRQKTEQNVIVQTSQNRQESQKTPIKFQVIDHKPGKSKIAYTNNNNREIAFDSVFYSLTDDIQQIECTYQQHIAQEQVQSSKPKLLIRERYYFLIKTFRKKCFNGKTDYEQKTYKPIFPHLNATLRNKLYRAGDQANAER